MQVGTKLTRMAFVLRVLMLGTSWGVALAVPANAQQDGLKIYISADMEGVTGAVTGDQLSPDGFEYQRFRQFLTDEVNAAIAGAREAGATEILVSDSHGNGENLLIEQLPEDVQVVRSWPRPLGMMEGIDATFDGVIFIGYHSSTTNPDGIRAHTTSSARLSAVRLNGVEMTEGAFSAAIAGHFGVPVIMISGDDAAVTEVQAVVGDIEGAIVKWAYSFHSARTLHPAAGQALIRERVRLAVNRIADGGFTPYTPDAPLRFDVTFKNYRPTQLLAYLPQIERIDSHTVRYVGDDMVDISTFYTFMMSYDSNLQP
ncbi:MAG: M55 family metallopeptidase [Vicinamibacterales bacterium]|nr:M55 family metallopeptidase [Vicinamibacterales bacterium]MDP7471487.1 M55 family metallopeptidase [Vicinamibacterales bacterium]MDP7670315.1 M55 family metallopeptidase [Vicinamibacterales bacterium]HJO37972.1 M55 family metallopeptidase [Vicinamibacterales bacterium]